MGPVVCPGARQASPSTVPGQSHSVSAAKSPQASPQTRRNQHTQGAPHSDNGSCQSRAVTAAHQRLVAPESPPNSRLLKKWCFAGKPSFHSFVGSTPWVAVDRKNNSSTFQEYVAQLVTECHILANYIAERPEIPTNLPLDSPQGVSTMKTKTIAATVLSMCLMLAGSSAFAADEMKKET